MTSPLIADAAAAKIRAELAVRLSHGHDAILREIPDLYRKIIGEALLAENGQLGQGAKLRAAQRALNRIADLGVVDIVDQSGRRWSMQSYVEMAGRTAALRAMLAAQTDVYRAQGIRFVYVTRVAGQCALCRPWEGRVLALDNAAVPAKIGGRTVRRTLADAVEAGCFHPNCRHQIRPWIPGRTNIPPPTPDPEAYEAQQHMRALERHVRHWRRRQAAAATPDARRLAADKIREWQQAIRDHAAATGTRRIRGRERIDRALPSPLPRHGSDTLHADRVEAEYRRNPGPQLTAVERAAVDTYIGIGRYTAINNALRAGEPPLPGDAGVVQALDNVIRRWTTPEPLTVYRAWGDYSPPRYEVGDVEVEDAYMSTALTEAGTGDFRGSGPYLVIDVPAGTHGVVVNGATRNAIFAKQRELLLPRGTRLVITSDGIEDGHRVIRATALPPRGGVK